MSRKTNLVISALLLFAVLPIGNAFTPPPPPPPVPQTLGMFDNSIDQLQTNATDQSACRVCHQSTGTNISGGYNNTLGGLDTRHHGMVARGVINPYSNSSFGCTDCHPSNPNVGNGMLLDHSCQDCHNDTNFWGDSIGARIGNISRPHHVNTSYDSANIGMPAANRQCNFCHGSFVDNYNDGHYIPSYSTSFMITPMATWKITNFTSPLSQIFFASDDTQVSFKTWGGCESCHVGNGGTGTNKNNHHNAVMRRIHPTPFNLPPDYHDTSPICHVMDNSDPKGLTPFFFNATVSNPTANGGIENLTNVTEVRNSTIEQIDAAIGAFEPGTTNVTINGTGCEKCHSVRSIHNIEAPGAGTTQGLGHIGNNSDCYGCHNSWLPLDTVPMAEAIVPSLNNVAPAVVSAGIPTTLTITGGNFVNNVTNTDGSVTNYTSVVDINGVIYTPSSITDSNIVVNIPAMPAGTYQLQLVKGGNTLSRLETLTVISNPTLISAKLGRQGGNLIITITGTGLGAKPATNAQLYVSTNHAGDQIVSSSVSKWSDTQIIAKMPSSVVSGDVVTVLTTNAGGAQTIIS